MSLPCSVTGLNFHVNRVRSLLFLYVFCISMSESHGLYVSRVALLLLLLSITNFQVSVCCSCCSLKLYHLINEISFLLFQTLIFLLLNNSRHFKQFSNLSSSSTSLNFTTIKPTNQDSSTNSPSFPLVQLLLK